MTATAPFEVSLRRVTAESVTDICDLSETLSEAQRGKVADNGQSIAEAHYSENAWFRGIYVDEEPAGFVMLHLGGDWHDGIEHDGAFLWRLMIAGPHQGKGVGQCALAMVIRGLRAKGFTELYTSYGLGEASPAGFYARLGFRPTGEMLGDEAEALLTFET